jgi:CheY-like chemotaxis protein
VLKTRNSASLPTAHSPATNLETEQLDLYTYVQTIKTSAKELISTVNSLIKLNQWAEIAQAERVMALHRIPDIEAALLHEVLIGLPDDLSIRPSIIISHRSPKNCDMLVTDMRVLLDCIQPLVVHAAQQSAGGVVAVTLTIKEDYQSLTVDVYHSGRAVRSPSETVTDIYTKEDLTTAESALGLTLACKAAALLDGEVALLSSKHDTGSYVRATFNDPICASSISSPLHPKDGIAQLPQKFYRLVSESPMSSLGHHFSHWLSNVGWSESKEKSESLVIVDYHSDLTQFYQQLASVGTEQVIVCLVPENATFLDFESKRVRRQENAVYVQGPFLTEQLLQAMELVAAILVESRRSSLKLGDCSFATVAAEPNLSSAVQSTATRTGRLVKQGSIFPKTTQTQVAESLQNLRLSPKPSLSAGKLGTNSKKPRTLLVDDNAVNLRLLQMYCNRRGIPYQTAADGQQAVKIFSEAVVTRYDPLLQQDVSATAFDLILMDLQMPECDGIDATRQIRQLEEENGWEKSVLFIVTGQDSPTDRKNAEEAGADEFLTKPLGPKVLDQWVKKWCPEAGI